MQVTQNAIGRFHHFHLARQLASRGLLRAIWTGYPRSKLQDETGIDPELIHTFSRYLIAERILPRIPLIRNSDVVKLALVWRHLEGIDRRAAGSLNEPTILAALSSSGLNSGRRAQALGGRYVCDRGSSHICFQQEILTEEYRRWRATPPSFDDRVIAKELEEYAAADRITVPSSFVFDSFVERGVPTDKMRLIPYGGRLDRFRPNGEPDPTWFTALFVGGVSLRKGIPYLLQAFARFPHPNKRLRIIGSIERRMALLLPSLPTENVEFLGQIPNVQLAHYYSTADVMLLPSIEEGLAMVMGEALACGCPVIATHNTGATELFEHGIEGLIVPIRDFGAVVDALTALADQPQWRAAMRQAARARVKRIGGWDTYGDHWAQLVAELRRS